MSSNSSGKGSNQPNKKRMCLDSSQTINRGIELDTDPLPRSDKMTNDLAKHKVFSSFGHKSAYNQVPLKLSDRKYTPFEVNGRLFQFCWIPLRVKNGAAAFRRTIDRIIEKKNSCGPFPYIDDFTIAGCTQSENEQKKFLGGYYLQ